MTWLTGWDYRKKHTILAQADAGTDYQVLIRVHKTQPNGMELAKNACPSPAQRPQAIYRDGVTFMVYAGNVYATFQAHIKAILHETDEFSSVYTIANLSWNDYHSSPCIGILPSNKLIVFYDGGSSGVNTLKYKISTYTIAEIKEDKTRLGDWGSVQVYSALTDIYYPNVSSFADKIVMNYSRQTTQWTNVTHWFDTFDGTSWSGAVKLMNHVADGSYMWFTKVGNNILMSGERRVTVSAGKRIDVYFLWSDDEGTTWRTADGTVLTLPLTAEHKVLSSPVSTRNWNCILDENNKPVIMCMFRDDPSSSTTGDYNVKVAQYSAALGESGTWSINDATSGGNQIIADGWGEQIDSLLGSVEGRPAFYIRAKVNGNHYVRRYIRQANETLIFDVSFTDQIEVAPISPAMIWDKLTSFSSETLIGENIAGTYDLILRYGAEIDNNMFTTNKCKDDFSDIRFTDDDGNTLLSYWRRNYISGRYADFWVKVTDDLSTENVDIYVYYENDEATITSDFDNTFIFGDPFDNETLNIGRWTSVDGNPVYIIDAVNHYIEITDMDGTNWYTGKGFHSKALTFPVQWIIEDAYDANANGVYLYEATTTTTDINAGHLSIHHTAFGGADVGVADIGLKDAWTSSSYGIEAGVGGNHDYDSGGIAGASKAIYAKMYKLSGAITVKQDGTTRVNAESNSETPNIVHLCVSRFASTVFGTQRFGAFIIRKYTSPEPTHSIWGNEEEEPSIYKPSSGSIATLMREMELI